MGQIVLICSIFFAVLHLKGMILDGSFSGICMGWSGKVT
ncbi:hypothetical protein bthur0011_43350 [Bacillus thuringiensis serovar huazhongensis BGSC 4BD1]|nr:hypothetical protein bthur0011_43350 [Bacillus thuringiensis serovar huazhongensis BGSC 4BD1]KLA28199.1 hypothetical protein B4080_4941 [Bacillus cereus]